jgi:hypothetical protein
LTTIFLLFTIAPTSRLQSRFVGGCRSVRGVLAGILLYRFIERGQLTPFDDP